MSGLAAVRLHPAIVGLAHVTELEAMGVTLGWGHRSSTLNHGAAQPLSVTTTSPRVQDIDASARSVQRLASKG